jgi:hypothetical protein
MPRGMPCPLAQAFVVCRQIYEDARTGEFILIGPLNHLPMPRSPFTIRLSLYVHLSGGHGLYQMAVHLRDSSDVIPWRWDLPKPLDLPDPLQQLQLGLYDLAIEIPKPGRYDLLLLANGEQMAQQSMLFLPPTKEA